MSNQMEYLENNQDMTNRLAEREKDLIEAVSLLQQENDRLRADYRALMEGSCYARTLQDLEQKEAENAALALKISALEYYLDDTLSDLKQANRLEQYAYDRRVDGGREMAAYSHDVANWLEIMNTAARTAQDVMPLETRQHAFCDVIVKLIDEFKNRCPEYKADDYGNVFPVSYSDIPF